MAEKSQIKWEGKATATLKRSKAEQVSPFWEDSTSTSTFQELTLVTKWNYRARPASSATALAPTVAQPPSDVDVDDDVKSQSSTTLWINEKLLYSDPLQRCLSYEILDNNMGMKNYVATTKVFPINDGDGRCRIEWTFVVDPIEGWRTLEHLAGYIENNLGLMAKNLEEALKESA